MPKLPNITGGSWFGLYANYCKDMGAIVHSLAAYNGGAANGDMRAQYQIDASRANAIYKDNATVQPPSLKYRVYTYYA